MPSKPKRTTQRNRADRLFSRIIRSIGYCEQCGKAENLQCAHGVTRSRYSVRWDEENAWCLCAACHKTFTHNPAAWELWLVEKMGSRRFWAMKRKSQGLVKVDYPELIARLEARLKEIE